MRTVDTRHGDSSKGKRRLSALVRIIKNHPIVGIIGIIGTIFGIAKGAPPAWDALMYFMNRPKCLFYVDKYAHSSGYFEHNNGKWIEDPPYSRAGRFEFIEVQRDREYIYLKNATPRAGPAGTMLVRLPACGGAAQWSYQNPQSWTDLYQVWKAN